MSNLLPNKAPISAMPTSTLTSNFQNLCPFSGLAPDNAGLSSVANSPMIPGPGAGVSSVADKPTIPGPVPLIHLTISQPLTSVALASGSVFAETSTISHKTPGPLQKSGQTIVSSPQTSLTSQKDVKVVQVLPQPSSELLVPAVTEAQPPILPNTQALKTFGDFSRYQGGRGSVRRVGGGRFRGSYYGGRGYYGYGYTARGRGRGLHT